MAYLNNYVVYLAWMGYALPVRLARESRLIGVPRLDIFVLIAPLGCAGIELVRTALDVFRSESLSRMRRLEPAQKQLWLGAAVTLAGGLVCCFLPIPRVMFAAALGPVLLIGGLPYLLRKSAGLRDTSVATACVLVLGVKQPLGTSDLIHDKRSDFVQLRELRYVESYFALLATCLKSGTCENRADYLRAQLVEAHLVDTVSGQLRPDTFQDYLTSIGDSRRRRAPDRPPTTGIQGCPSTMKYEKILVTGGAGFVGIHLCRDLIRRGFTVRVLDNLGSAGPSGRSLAARRPCPQRWSGCVAT